MPNAEEIIRNLRLEASPYSQDAALEIERLCRLIAVCAKQADKDEGAIQEIASNAIGEDYLSRLWDDISDEELWALAYPGGPGRVLVSPTEGRLPK